MQTSAWQGGPPTSAPGRRSCRPFTTQPSTAGAGRRITREGKVTFLDRSFLENDAERDAYHYRTHGGAELDLLIVRGARRFGFEAKHGDTPAITKSMHVAVADLRLEHLFIVHPGERSFPLDSRISSLALRDLDAEVRRRKLR